ncbi:PAS domain-containing protein [Rubrimonas cliftonensis]|uniref:histidine kinase n=1 Tax=Rubrimonas cliftonensis TaxID=89524 RepID=A0A1H3XQZ2_9RHOB|nr:PAS domain-containing protein [Rubrimonas cliftonensis]SEA00938.1 PAS domain S-box-containing protein [Rubrimonas cliftonensis]
MAGFAVKLPKSAIDDLIAQTEAYGDDAIVLVDADPDAPAPLILWCNAGFCAMTGYSPAEIVGRTPAFLRGPLTDAETIARLAEARRAGRPRRERFVNYRKNGEPFWVDASYLPVPVEGGEPGRPRLWMSIQRDVTAERAAEKALEESRRRADLLADVVDSVTSEIHIFDARSFLYEMLNEEARRSLGLAAERLSEVGPADFWPAFDADGLRLSLAPLLEGRERAVALRVEQRCADGALRPYRARLTTLRRDARSLIVAVLVDVTEEERAQAQAALGEARLRIAVDASLDGLWELEVPGRRVKYSDRYREMLGYDAESFPDLLDSWLRRLHPDDVERVMAASDRCRIDGEPFDETYRIRRRDGSWVWWRSRAAALRDPQGRPTSVIGVNSDVSALMEARAAAEEIARMRRDFLAKMSHEVRTPLNGVLGMTALLLAAENRPEVVARLKAIESSGLSLLAIIEDVLALARIEAGAAVHRSETFEPRALCEAALDPIRAIALGKGLRLAAAAPSGTWRGDARMIRQVLINLAGNAAKFTVSGGVTITAGTEAGGRALRFTVADTGPGVPEAQREAIFEPFRQGDDSVTRRHGGLGLGLAVAREIVHGMGGEIGVAAAPGGGAAFWFTAPATPSAADEA